MRIARVESLHADAGQRVFDVLQVSTDEGPVGWSEHNETSGGPGVGAVIERLAPALVGRAPRAHEAIMAHLQALRRPALGGVVQQASGAIENALHDVKARALAHPRRPRRGRAGGGGTRPHGAGDRHPAAGRALFPVGAGLRPARAGLPRASTPSARRSAPCGTSWPRSGRAPGR